MFTGSTDHNPWPEESATRVAIVGSSARQPGFGPDLDLPDLDLRDLDLRDLDLPDLDLPDLGVVDDEWMAQAACRGRTNLFFGIAGERPERRVRREHTARGVCEGCAVVAPCRERARAGRENGYWGGESEEERAAAGYPPRSISRRSVQQASTIRAAAS